MEPWQIVGYGDYYLTRKIATGGMAELFRARKVGEAGFEKLLVVKRLLPHLAADEEFLAMFLDEARLASQLSNQNIVQVYDLGKAREQHPSRPRSETTYFIAMEYVFGKSLAEVLKRGQARERPLAPADAVKVVLGAAHGLEYAHRKAGPDGRPLGLVHRDVSPQNLLISYDGEVKLTDFGIAKALSQSQTTRPGVLKGKFAYMPPEQARGEALDARADLYSLGVVFWEALCGRRLFAGENEAAILAKVLDPKVEPPSRAVPGLPPELDRVVMRCLAPVPADRYPEARGLIEDLEGWLHATGGFPSGLSLHNHLHEAFAAEIEKETGQIKEEIEAVRALIASPPDADEVPADEATVVVGRGGGAKRGRGLLWAGLAAGLLAILAVAGFWLLGRPPATSPPPPAASAPAPASSGSQAPPPLPPVAPAETAAPAVSAAPAAPAAPGETSPAAPAASGETTAKPEAAPPATPAPPPPPELAEGRAALAEKRFADALAKFDAALAARPELAAELGRPRAEALLGMAGLALARQPEEALALATRAAEAAPDWAPAQLQVGRIQLRLERFADALASCERAVALDPELAAAHFNRGYALLSLGRHAEAVAAYRRVVSLDAALAADAYVDMAVAHHKQGERAAALKALKEALDLNPNHQLAKRYLRQLERRDQNAAGRQ